MKKIIFLILWLLIINSNSFSQFELNNSPLKVTASLKKNDSALIITYQNSSNQEIALWVGDWMVDYISNKYNYSFLNRPIKNSILFYNKKRIRNHVFNYYYITDTLPMLSAKNYKILAPKEKFIVNIKSTGAKMNQMFQKISVWISFSLIDINSMCIYLKNIKFSNANDSRPCSFVDNNLFFNDSQISINNVDWPDILKKEKNNSSSVDLPLKVDEKKSTQLIQSYQVDEATLAPSVKVVELFHKNFGVTVRLLSK